MLVKGTPDIPSQCWRPAGLPGEIWIILLVRVGRLTACTVGYEHIISFWGLRSTQTVRRNSRNILGKFHRLKHGDSLIS